MLRDFFLLIAIVLCLNGCKDEEISCSDVPKLTTNAISNATDTSVSVSGNFISPTCKTRVLSKGFAYSTEPLPKITDFFEPKLPNDTAELTGLEANQTYYCRTYLRTSDNIFYGNEISFATCTDTPIITTDSFSYLTDRSVVMFGTFGDLNCKTNALSKGFVYASTNSPTLDNSVVEQNENEVSTKISNLQPNQTYYCRAYFTTSTDTYFGEEIEFTTSNGDIFFDENGITLKASEFTEIGFTKKINGIDYKVIDKQMLENSISAGETLSNLVTTKITDMSELFYDVGVFDNEINSWDVSNVTDMFEMFRLSSVSNIDISAWNVSSVTNMSFMFADSEFNGKLNAYKKDENQNDVLSTWWDVSSVTDMSSMFAGTKFNGELSAWNVSSVTNMSQMFFDTPFNGSIANWNVSNVTNMYRLFYEAKSFNQNMSKWNVSKVTNMEGMFAFSEDFDQEISSWNVDKVTNMSQMFYDAAKFNSDISTWNVSLVENMEDMFREASSFNKDIRSWQVSTVTNCTNFSLNANSEWETTSKPSFVNCTD